MPGPHMYCNEYCISLYVLRTVVPYRNDSKAVLKYSTDAPPAQLLIMPLRLHAKCENAKYPNTLLAILMSSSATCTRSTAACVPPWLFELPC